MIEFMSGKEGFSIVLYGDNAYTKEELTSHGLPESLSKQDILELSKIRYALSTNSFKKYMAVTIASNISEKSVAAIRENQPELQGIDIVEDSVRKYIDDASMGPILGYTGQASSEELEELRQKNPDYSMMRSSVNRELRNIWKHLFREQTVKKLSLSITLAKYLRLTTARE